MTDVNVLDVDKVKCPSCGAGMDFAPDIGALKCDHCGRIEKIDAPIGEEQDFFKTTSGNWNGEALAYKCDNCYAVTVFPKGEIAGKCPFCGASNVLAREDMTGIKPNAIIPFALTRDEAKVYYKRWIKKKLYAPRRLKKDFVADSVKGIYVPCWTYDTVTDSRYVARFGKYYYVTIGSGKNRRTVRRTKWYTVSGSYSEAFDDIVVESGEKITQSQLESVMPFSTGKAVKYDAKYLSGFSAERYSEGVRECFERAKSYVASVIRNRIISKYNPDVVGHLNVTTTHSNVTYKYVLLPVWLCGFKYNGRDYGFLVNGETGRVKGKAPVSWLKVLLTVLGVVAVIGALVYFL